MENFNAIVVTEAPICYQTKQLSYGKKSNARGRCDLMVELWTSDQRDTLENQMGKMTLKLQTIKNKTIARLGLSL